MPLQQQVVDKFLARLAESGALVITTHDRLWAEQMQSAGLVTSVVKPAQDRA